ncbi:MAG: conjugal transfer protein TraF [Gammaproteobacteria bacterium]|nr:conjugal transfer protein TraF [Gammaproteobacteria bacterium]
MISGNAVADGRANGDVTSLALGGTLTTPIMSYIAGANPAQLPMLRDPTELLIYPGSYTEGHGTERDYNAALANYQSQYDQFLASPSANTQSSLESAAQRFASSDQQESKHAFGGIVLPHLPISLDAQVQVHHQAAFRGSKTATSDYSDPNQPLTHVYGDYRALTSVTMAATFAGIVLGDAASARQLSIGIRPKLVSLRSRAYHFSAHNISGIPYASDFARQFNLDVGALYRVDTLYTGLSVHNVQPQAVDFFLVPGSYRQRPDARLGIAHQQGRWFSTAEVELVPVQDLWGEDSQHVRAGLEFSPRARFALRAGVAYDLLAQYPTALSAGLGYNSEWLTLNAFGQASTDALSTGLSLGIRL